MVDAVRNHIFSDVRTQEKIGLITHQRSLVQIQPPQPSKTRGWRTQEPLTPFVYPDSTQELPRKLLPTRAKEIKADGGEPEPREAEDHAARHGESGAPARSPGRNWPRSRPRGPAPWCCAMMGLSVPITP
jgi:hypothetical protein